MFYKVSKWTTRLRCINCHSYIRGLGVRVRPECGNDSPPWPQNTYHEIGRWVETTVWQRKVKERQTMQVKIGDKTYDSNDEPIMIILSKRDKSNIANMIDSANKYCSYPDWMDREDIRKWMDEKNE